MKRVVQMYGTYYESASFTVVMGWMGRICEGGLVIIIEIGVNTYFPSKIQQGDSSVLSLGSKPQHLECMKGNQMTEHTAKRDKNTVLSTKI